MIHLAFGGASLGAGAGYGYHLWRLATEGSVKGAAVPSAPVPAEEIPRAT